MLSRDELAYLKKIPPEKIFNLQPFNARASITAGNIIDSIKKIYPFLDVIHMGSSALCISGQNDLDIYALSDISDFDKYLPGLTQLFGKPIHKHPTFIEWQFIKDGFEVEFYLTTSKSNSMKRQIKVFEILKNDPQLLKDYEKIKIDSDTKPYRDYQRKKYLFYNKLLNR